MSKRYTYLASAAVFTLATSLAALAMAIAYAVSR